MQNYQVVLFDLDGTITDSKLGILNSVLYSLAKFDISIEDLDSLNCFIGPPLLESFQEFCHFDKAKAHLAIQYYREYFANTGIFENAVYPGIPQLLSHLKDAGKQLLVATNKPTVFAERIISHFQLDDYFAAIIGSNLDGTLGTKTAVINYALSKVPQVAKENAIMIGDRKHDIIGAQQNGIASIGVTYGYGSSDELQLAQPTYLTDTVEDLRLIICS